MINVPSRDDVGGPPKTKGRIVEIGLLLQSERSYRFPSRELTNDFGETFTDIECIHQSAMHDDELISLFQSINCMGIGEREYWKRAYSEKGLVRALQIDYSRSTDFAYILASSIAGTEF